MAELGCSAFQADRHLHAMAQAGYLFHDSDLPLSRPSRPRIQEPIPGLAEIAERMNTPGSEWAVQDGSSHWYLTPIAYQLRVDKLLKRMTRPQAEALYARLLSEVRAINATPETLLCISRVEMFGSMLDQARDSYGDIDIHISTSEIPAFGSAHADLVARLANEARRTEAYTVAYCEDHDAALIRSAKLVRMRLEKLGRRISLSRQSPQEIDTPSIEIYRFNSRTGQEICETLVDVAKATKALVKHGHPPPRSHHESKVKTVGYPETVPEKPGQLHWRKDIINTKDLVEKTASLLEISARTKPPCPHCQSFWCEHVAPTAPRPVIEGSSDHYLVALERAMEENPLGHPIREVKAALQTIGQTPSSRWHRRFSPSSRYLSVTKGGMKFYQSIEHHYSVSKYDHFAVTSGRIDLHTSLSNHPNIEHFVSLMRLHAALLLLWKSCGFAGGSDAGVLLDLDANGIEDLDLSSLRVLGKLQKAAHPARKELVKNHPFPKEHALALKASVDEDDIYRPGGFRLVARIEPDETLVRIFCWARRLRGASDGGRFTDDFGYDLGDGEGTDAETSTARSLLETQVSKHANAIRKIPGLKSCYLDNRHLLDYPEI